MSPILLTIMMIWHPEVMGWETVITKATPAPSMEQCEELIKTFEPDAIEVEDGHKFVMIYQCEQGV